MFITRGIAAVAIALALAFVGIAGSNGHDTDSETTEVAGGTWS